MYDITGDEAGAYLNLAPETIQLQYIYVPLNIFYCILGGDGIVQVCCDGPVDTTFMGKKTVTKR